MPCHPCFKFHRLIKGKCVYLRQIAKIISDIIFIKTEDFYIDFIFKTQQNDNRDEKHITMTEVNRQENTKIHFSNKQLAKLIWPLMIEQFLSIAVGLSDSMMVAQVGDASVSAVSLVDSISVFMVYVFSAMAAGGAAVCGQFIGRKKEEDARRSGQHLILLMTVLSVAVTLLMYVFRSFILTHLFGKIDADVMLATDKYYTIVMAAIPAIALYNAGAALFRAMERTDMTLKVSLVMNAINVGGNAVLIFVFKMDVAGVAIPTLVSRWVAAALILCLLLNKKYVLRITGLKGFKYNGMIMKNIFRIGVPGGVENGMFQLGKIILVSLVSTMGTTSITANAIGNTMAPLQVFQGFAVNLAMTTVISQCIGAGAYEKAKYYLKKLMIITYGLNVIVITTLLLLIPVILDLYGVSPEAADLARKLMLIHGISAMVLWVPSFMLPNFLRAAGDAGYPMIVSSICMWAGRIGFSYLFCKGFGMDLTAVWFSQTLIDWGARIVCFVIRYKRGKWKTKGITVV